MVPIDFLSQAAWQRVAVTLLHFVWQGSAVAVVAAVVVRLGRLGGAAGRYAVYVAALGGMIACPVVTFWVVEAPFTAPAEAEHVASPARPADGEAVPAPRREAIGVEVREAAPTPREAPDAPAAAPPAPVATEDAPTPSATWRDVATRRLPAVLGWVSVMWLAGAGAMSLRLGLGVVGTVRWRRGLSPLGPPLAAAVEALCERMGLGGFRRVFVSPHVPQAVAMGCLRPMVLLPAAMLTGMPAEMIQAIVAHELAHIRRLDLWVNLLQRVTETLLFFHPAVWWLSGRLRSERELCCDELAVAATGERLTYAEALEHVYRSGLPAAQPIAAGALGAGKRTTLARVRHVLGLSASPGRSRWWSAGASALLVVLAVAIGLAVSSTGRDAAKATEDAPAAGGNYNHLLYIRQDIRDGGLRGNTLMLARVSGGEPRVRPLSAVGGGVYPSRRLLKVVRGRLYALYGRTLVEVDLKTGRRRIVADDVGARDYHPSGRLYFVGKNRLAVYDFPRGAFRDIGPSPFRQIREMRIAISPDERRLAFCENVYEAKEKWSKAKPLPGAKATPSGLSPGYRHMLNTRIVVLDLRDGKQTRMPTPFCTPYPQGGSKEGPPPPLAWRDRKTVLVVRGDRAVRGRPTRGLAVVDVETGRMRDVLAIPGDHHTVPSFVVGERDGRVRLALSRDRWAADTYRIDLAAARLLEDNALAAGVRLGHAGGSRCILHNRRPVSDSKGVAHVRASPGGKRIAWCVANAGTSWVNRALHVYDVAAAASRKVADDYVAGAPTWVADADLPPGEPPPPPPGWKRLTMRPWPKPRPRPVDNRPDVAGVLSLTIATDKKEYTQHERVRITVTLTNKTRKAVTFSRPRLFVGLTYANGSESLGQFDHPADMFPDDVVHLAAGQSVRCTRTVGTYDLGKHTVGGQCGKTFAQWRGRLTARAATFVTRRTADSDRVLKARFDRQIAAFRRKLPTDGGAWQWGRQLGPTMARHMIAEIEASGDAKFRNRMGWALIGMGGRDVVRFCGRCLAGRMQSARGVVLDCLLRAYRNSSGTARREALGLLVEALKHRDPRVRRGAAARLSQVRHPGVRAALTAAVADDNAGTAVTAARYLAACEDLDLADWLAAAAKEPTHARYLAARAFINEIESAWQTGQAKPPSGTWRQVSKDPAALEKFRNTVRTWERWARENPSFSARFFLEARRHWPKPKPPPAGTPGPPVKSTSPHDGSGKTTVRADAKPEPPAVKKGKKPLEKLQLVLSPLGRVREGQPVALNLSVKNAGGKPLFLPWPRFIDFFITTHITHPLGKTVRLRHPALSIGHGICPGENLKPGDTWKVRLSERKVLDPSILVPIWFPAHGTYRVKCFLDLSPNRAPWFGFWRGKAESAELVVDVKPHPPAAANGLAVWIYPKKPVFDKGKPLKFVLRYRNTSKKALALRLMPSYGGKLAIGTTLEIELQAPKPEWKPWKVQEYWLATAKVPPAKPVLKTLEPGQIHEETISLGAIAYQFWRGKDRAKPTNLQKNLPPYWYRLVMRIDAPKDSGVWSGKATCWSEEFKIGTIEHSVPLKPKK